MGWMFVKLKDNKGIALIITFFVITVLFIYLAAFVGISINQNIAADIYRRRIQAYNLAEAGLDHGITQLRTYDPPPVGAFGTILWSSGLQDLAGGTYNVSIEHRGEVVGSPGTRRYRVISTGTFGNKSRTLSNHVQVDNFARYIWFTDSETFSGTNVWFWAPPGQPGVGDHLNGETHTNAHFNIYGDPRFDGYASSTDTYIRFYNNGSPTNLYYTTTNPNPDEPFFEHGVDFGVEPTVMPAQATALRSAASSAGGLLLSGNTTIVLNNNGTMDLTNSTYCSNPLNDCDDAPLPVNGSIFVACGGSKCSAGGSLTISGTLDGRLTIGAQRDIIIPNNIVYVNDPRDDDPINHPELCSDDVLGLISERNVMITNNAPSNLEIDGCIMAMNTSFMRDNYSSGLKGKLTVYGGIIQDQRGPVGTFNGSTGVKLSGYDKNYAYDTRLLNNPPPFMPTTGDYVTLSWEED